MMFVRLVVLLLWTLLFREGDLEEIGCPVKCTCSEIDGSPGWAVWCTFMTRIFEFPRNATDIYIHTSETPDIESGVFSKLSDVSSIRIVGQIGTIQNGAFRNITGRKGEESRFVFGEVNVQKIESGAFSGVSGFSSFLFTTFNIEELESQAFGDFHTIRKVAFKSGSFRQIPTASFKDFSVIGEMLFQSINASTLKTNVFLGANIIGNMTFLSSTIGVIGSGALGSMSCLGGLHIISCHVGNFLSFALNGTDNVRILEITDTVIAQRTERIFEGIGRVSNYDLQSDLVHLIPEKRAGPSPDCSLPSQVPPLIHEPQSIGTPGVIAVGVSIGILLLAICVCFVICVRGILGGYLCVPYGPTESDDELRNRNKARLAARARMAPHSRARASEVQRKETSREPQSASNQAYSDVEL